MGNSYYSLIERKEKLMAETEALRARKERVDRFISSLSDEEKGIITERFIRGLTLSQVGFRHHYSVSGIQWRIVSIIKKGV